MVQLLKPKCAVILAGCGAKDGAEITEAVSLIVTLQQQNFDVKIFAPDRPFHHVVDHLSGNVCENEQRNMLSEAARIARGKIQPISAVDVDNFDCLAFSGGFGVAKNLCNFAFEGTHATLFQDVKETLEGFIKAKKPVAALCISPILIACAVRNLGLKDAALTFGPADCQPAQIIESWGLKHISVAVNEACVDLEHKFVSAPAYMYDNVSHADVFASASALSKNLKSFFD